MIPRNGRLVGSVKLVGDRDVALARREVSAAFDAAGGRAIRKTRFVTAVSEIARNAVMHGGGGSLSVFVHEGRPTRVSVVCTDQGPGIADIDKALSDGFSSVRSMGKGLGGARRLVDEFEIRSSSETGTTVRMIGVV
ncbi:ATP-binding protein [Brevirhabdus sp.]|uniref:ATP-binding protein n=1 Tax=Brevirhabdus sp. TaxID=2004514 RepID=UPI00405A19AB